MDFLLGYLFFSLPLWEKIKVYIVRHIQEREQSRMGPREEHFTL